MEIQTTFKELSKKLENLDFSPETPVRIIIEKDKAEEGAVRSKSRQESYLPFLDSEMWDEEVPEDLSSNVDYYLYELDDSCEK